MKDIEGNTIYIGNIVYYSKFSRILKGRVTRLTPKSITVTCGRGAWENYREGKYTLHTQGYVIDEIPLEKHNSHKRINTYSDGERYLGILKQK